MADVLYGGSAGPRAPRFAGATRAFARVTPGGGWGSGARVWGLQVVGDWRLSGE